MSDCGRKQRLGSVRLRTQHWKPGQVHGEDSVRKYKCFCLGVPIASIFSWLVLLESVFLCPICFLSGFSPDVFYFSFPFFDSSETRLTARVPIIYRKLIKPTPWGKRKTKLYTSEQHEMQIFFTQGSKISLRDFSNTLQI